MQEIANVNNDGLLRLHAVDREMMRCINMAKNLGMVIVEADEDENNFEYGIAVEHESSQYQNNELLAYCIVESGILVAKDGSP
jgi:hypothetical protein